MKSLSDLAGFYLICFDLGEIGLDEIAKWADFELGKGSFSNELICLSIKEFELGLNQRDMLFRIWSSDLSSNSVKIFLGHLFKKLTSRKVTGHQACKMVWLMMADEERSRELVCVTSSLDFSLNFQRPGFFRSESDAYLYYVALLEPFKEFAPKQFF
jgi:hypothetical protein